MAKQNPSMTIEQAAAKMMDTESVKNYYALACERAKNAYNHALTNRLACECTQYNYVFRIPVEMKKHGIEGRALHNARAAAKREGNLLSLAIYDARKANARYRLAKKRFAEM